MAETDHEMHEISPEDLKREITVILNTASLDKTSTKKVIQQLEHKFGVNLTGQKKLIDQIVMEYVNSMDSEEDSTEEEPPVKVSKKKTKKECDDEDEEEHDDSNDSDWGFHHTGHHHHSGHLLDGFSDEGCRPIPPESSVATTGMRLSPNGPRKAVILKRVPQTTDKAEDEADIFGKLTAKKLRKLSEEKRDSMMIQINQLFYDKKYKRPCAPKRKMVDRSTSMPPPIMCETRKVYRVNDIASLFANTANVEVLSGTAIPVVTGLPMSFVEPTNGPKPVVPPSIVPKPVVQEARKAPIPVAAPPAEPTIEIAVENPDEAAYNCGIM